MYAYNYSIDDHFTGAPTPGSNPGWMQPVFVGHAAGQAMLLFEGNQGLGLQGDNVWGSNHFFTMFRNHFFGDIFDNPPKTVNTSVIHLWKLNRFHNVVGNVLGRAGYYTQYESDLVNQDNAVFSMGDSDPGSGLSADPRVRATLMRWGNYDTATATSRFLAAEVPSGLTAFSNPVPASQTLPASFYRSSMPSAWWATPWGVPAWPPVGPDVTGGAVPGFAGHAHKNPARLCFENSPIDTAFGSANVRSFSASTCYSPTGAPNAPSNLVVQ